MTTTVYHRRDIIVGLTVLIACLGGASCAFKLRMNHITFKLLDYCYCICLSGL